VADPRGTGGALEGSPRGPQQQNPYDSLKKLFGGNLQRSGGGFGGGLQDLFGRIGQQTGQMQGSPNSEYEGRNPDGSSFRLQFPMGNNFESSRSFWSHRSTNWANARFSNKALSTRVVIPMVLHLGRSFLWGIIRLGLESMTQGPESMLEQPLREEVGDTFNRRIQGQMGQSQGRNLLPRKPGQAAGIAQHGV
jgi:hypothetical protein